MGVLFDYTQAEEAEPEMRCLGRFCETKTTVNWHECLNKQLWLSALMQGLLRTVCVCDWPLFKVTQLSFILWVLLYVFVDSYMCAVSHISRKILVCNIYQNHVICVFLFFFFSVDFAMGAVEFCGTLAMMARIQPNPTHNWSSKVLGRPKLTKYHKPRTINHQTLYLLLELLCLLALNFVDGRLGNMLAFQKNKKKSLVDTSLRVAFYN